MYLEENLSKGDRCVLLSENRPEWLIADLAIMNAGGVTVPLFTTYSEKDYEYIFKDCEPKICIISNEIQFKKWYFKSFNEPFDIQKRQSIIESSSNWYLESDYESDFSDAD